MQEAGRKTTIPLTGADCFIWVLEKFNKVVGASGNTCRYLLEVEGKVDFAAFRELITTSPELQFLSSLQIRRANPFSRAYWLPKAPTEIPVEQHATDEFIPKIVLERKFITEQKMLFFFDVLYRSNGNTCIIFSWNHLLLDGFGAALLLRKLNNPVQSITMLPAACAKHPFPSLKEATIAKFFIGKSSNKSLSGFTPRQRQKQVQQLIKIITFTQQETRHIEQLCPKLGARFGPSPLFFAASARAVKEILSARGLPVQYLFAPAPQNVRKKGAVGPVVGNHLSFLFYLLSAAQLTSLPQCVQAVNDQMVQQVKVGMPQSYNELMRYLKHVPQWLYNYYISGKWGKTLSSFAFTVAEDHPVELMNFVGHKVINALSFPPNIYPPGLTLAFMRFDGRLQLIALSYKETLTEKEFDILENCIRADLSHPLPA